MDKEIYYRIVEELVVLRKKHCISINKMADDIGVTRQSIYNFETCRNKSYKAVYGYLTHPAFSREELAHIYDLMGG